MNEFDPVNTAEFERRKAEQIANQVKKKKEFSDDFKWFMGDPKGRRLMFWMLSYAGVYRTTFEESPQRASYMALAMAHAEGRKELGYRLMGEISRLCPEQYARMMKENADG